MTAFLVGIAVLLAARTRSIANHPDVSAPKRLSVGS
jgi:hypothetical protein